MQYSCTRYARSPSLGRFTCLHHVGRLSDHAPSAATDEKADGNEPLEGDKAVSEVRAEPYSLPEGFKWDTLNLDDPEQVRLTVAGSVIILIDFFLLKLLRSVMTIAGLWDVG